MEKQDLKKYILETPYNTNPEVVLSMAEEIFSNNVPNTYTAADIGKVVRLQGGGSGSRYGLSTQTAVTKTGVGTYNTTYNNQVTVQLAALTDSATAADIAEGKTVYGADGAVITGTASGMGGSGAQMYTISGTGATPQEIPQGVTSVWEIDEETGVASVMSAVQITLGTQKAVAMYRSGSIMSGQVQFAGASGMGNTQAAFDYNSHDNTIYPIGLYIGETDYGSYISSITWTITIIDNRASDDSGD